MGLAAGAGDGVGLSICLKRPNVLLCCAHVQALVRLVYVIAVAQAAHFRRLSGKATTAQGVDGVLAPHLLPFLRRAHIVQSLLTSATASDTCVALPFCQQTQDIQAGAESNHQVAAFPLRCSSTCSALLQPPVCQRSAYHVGKANVLVQPPLPALPLSGVHIGLDQRGSLVNHERLIIRGQQRASSAVPAVCMTSELGLPLCKA